MTELEERLPRVAEVIAEGRAEGLHTGGQLYVSRDGVPAVDAAFGEAHPDRPMTTGHLLRWMSAVKPIMAVAVGQLWEEGRIALDDAVARHIPEFAAEGKEAVTIRHLLTHTAGLPFVDASWTGLSWDEVIAQLSAAPLQPDWTPGKQAGYDPGSGWFVLGEVVRRLTGLNYPEYARERILLPLGMRDSWVGMSEEVYRSYGDRIAAVYDTSAGTPQPLAWATADLVTPWPGGSGRGPVRELGRFYEMLRDRGTLEGASLLSSQTVEALTARHRVRIQDRTFGYIYDWGLGFMLDSKGSQPLKQMSYDFGAHCSPRAFGHGGSQCAMGFCDPEHGLVVAWAFNGLPGEPRHRRRNHALNTAIYEDLRIANP